MTIAYDAAVALSISLASLASSADFTAGQESAEVDWTAVLKDDAQISGRIMVGTSPAANTSIIGWLWGHHTSLGSSPLDVLDGTDSAETITSAGILATLFAPTPLFVLSVSATTSNRSYPFSARSVASFFGGIMPAFWGLYVAHNTGVNLNSTSGNHEIKYRPVNWS